MVYVPDSTYDEGDAACGNYSQRLGGREAAVGTGVTAAQWKPGAAMPVPTQEQVKHPKRLLMSDLELLHLRHAALCVQAAMYNDNNGRHEHRSICGIEGEFRSAACASLDGRSFFRPTSWRG